MFPLTSGSGAEVIQIMASNLKREMDEELQTVGHWGASFSVGSSPASSQQHRSAAHRTGPVQSVRGAGSSRPAILVWFWCIGCCGVSCLDFLSVTAFYVAQPFLLFFCVACHLLFEELYFSHLECLVILCTSLVYVYELQ